MNHKIYSMRVLTGPCLLLTLLAGCGGAPADGFKGQRASSVSGTITLDGKPVPKGCQVMFMASQGNYIGTAVTGGDGKYSLRYELSAGLPATDYAVQITPPVEASKPADNPQDPMKLPPLKTNEKKPTEAELNETAVIPPRYTSKLTSDLKVTVKPGANTANFDLTRQKK